MASVRELRDRIRSLKNTRQITKAMKQVAAAKIRRTEAARKRARPYAEALAEMLRDLVAAVSIVEHPFMKPGKEGVPPGVILMTADKGLAGAFNSNVIRVGEAYAHEHPGTYFYSVGVKARNAVRRMGSREHPTWRLNAPKLETAHAVAMRVTQDFDAGAIGEIVLVSSTLVSMLSQRPQTRRLVPVVADELRAPQGQSGAPRGAVEFLPSPEFVLSALLPKYLEFTLYAAMLETDAAFFAAQLIAMSNATENANKAIDELTIAMNNARQAAITKELLEIVAGAEALSG
ncbi:MAG TPA: ATP synthase F1 subunit gamma [Candidatus Tyrphobacter sp.]